MGEQENRRHARRKVIWMGVLKFGQYDFDCRIWNVSAAGARISAGLPLLVGTELVIYLSKAGHLPAKVVWQEGEELGIEFVEDVTDVLKKFGDSSKKFGLED